MDNAPPGPSNQNPADPSTETVFLGGRAAPPLRAESTERGTVVGRYVILERIGTGGMGVVYAAYDPELDRKVALKLLRPDRVAGKDQRVRLLREAQAIARLSHPNVVTVHDTGAVGDQIFIAMEFVAGRTLRQWLREEKPTWRQVVEVFLLAGRGLAAAHAAGLVHRDFKPDNVLLGADGRARVADFGLARSVGEAAEASPESPPSSGSGPLLASPLTQPGAAMGTPPYMAPEQIRGEAVDARSDQFSFCVSLYEAFYGERPFEGRDSKEIAAAVERGASPPSGSRVPQRIREALMRGLSADPAHRYPSMTDLLRDLERDPAAVRRRWLAAAAVVLVTGALFSSLGYLQARRERLCTGAEEKVAGIWNAEKKREVRAAFLATGAPFAGAVAGSVERSLDRYLRDWAGARREACEATRLRGEQSEDLLDRRMFCLDQRLQQAAAVVGLFAGADLQVVEKAVSSTAELPRLEACANAGALTAKLPPPGDPNLRARVEAARGRLAEVQALTSAGKFKEALPRAGEVAELARRLGYGPLAAETLYQKARLEDLTGDYPKAEATMFETLVAAHAARHQEVAARAASQLAAIVGFKQSRVPEGERWAHLAEGIAEGAQGGDALRSELFQHLGIAMAGGGRYEEAAAASSKALALAERSGRPPDAVAALHTNLSELYQELGRNEEALRHVRRGLEIRRKVLDPDHPDFGRSYNSLGNIYTNLHRYKEAAAAFENSVQVSRRHYGPNHLLTAGALFNLGTAYQNLDRLDDAMRCNRQAQKSLEILYGPDHPYVAMALTNVGEVLRLQHEPAQSLAAYQRALEIQEKTLGPDHVNLAYSLVGISKALLELGRAAEAIPASRRALALFESQPIDPGLVHQTRYVLACVLWEGGGDRGQALELARRARAGFAERKQPEEERMVADWLRQKGQAS
ncbi:MAG TPA: serine/threonine-protein kinase [Thermoanaerobaculia bacterium]